MTQDTHAPAALRFVNAYEVGQCWGGPEEGGWWYDAGTPLASIPARTDEEVAQARAVLFELFGPSFGLTTTGEKDEESDHRPRTSVIGDNDLEIYVEESVAAPFPTVRPHYE